MAAPRLSREIAEETVARVQACVDDGYSLVGKPSAVMEAARRSGVSEGTMNARYKRAATLYGLAAVPRNSAVEAAVSSPPDLSERIRSLLLLAPLTLSSLTAKTGAPLGLVIDALGALESRGIKLHRVGDRYEIPKLIEPAYVSRGAEVVVTSRPDNTFLFGVAGDKHIASKYHREDVLSDLYRRFEDAGVDAVFDTGNWIDGEARFNRYDILAHGLDAQVRLMAASHPKSSITTYAVWGDDHEGWYAQREGIDVGKYAAQVMAEAGHAWVDIGFMEAHVILRNHETGAESMMTVVHPGGGSAYATSYAPQKAIEALEGGEKPAVILFGHWHKLEALNVRNVWSIQTGTCQDQTPFARKKRLDFHVGGLLLRLEQDPVSGAIIGCAPDMKRYFNRGFYDRRWSHHGGVTRVERSLGGV